MTTQATAPARRRRATLAITAGIVVVLLIAFFVFAGLYADALWFGQLGYSGVLYTEWTTISSLFVLGLAGMAVPVWVSMQLAYRLRPVYAKLTAQLDRYQQVIEPLRRVVMLGLPIIIGLFAAVSTSTHWQPVLLMLHGSATGTTDPVFHIDTSFYLFVLPVLHGLCGYLSAVLVVCVIAGAATAYLYGALRIAGREVRISRPARIQIAITLALFLVVQAVSLFLDQYLTLTDLSSGGTFTGAGYADVNAVIPGRVILSVICLLVAALFVVTAFVGRWRLPVVGTALLVVSSIIVGSVFPWVMQNLEVRPSGASYEKPYIADAIAATRDAYDVSGVKTIPYTATTSTASGALRNDAETTANIRIIDPAVVQPTFGQLQQIKQFYDFANPLDVDRYTIDGKSQDAVVGVRELRQAGLGTSRTAYNDAFVYTHGYGIVAAYGNKRATDGSPEFLESNIPTTGSLPTYEPRVYFGEQSPTYSIVGAPKGTTPIELDYPDANGSGQETNTFTGDGGPKVGSLLNRLVYSLKFQSDQILLSNAVNADSQILYDRNPKLRVQKVAPYLTIDHDPYPSVVDGRLVWIVDGYTTSDSYPYSSTQSLSDLISDADNSITPYPTDQINYIRNSVKATVDAYTGKVTLYAWDTTDPVLKAWMNTFPGTLKPMSDMSADLMSHVRYPEDLFRMQRAILARYHVTNPTSWYQQADSWKVPNEPNDNGTSSTQQPPYYLTMQLPGQTTPTFSLYSTYIPNQQGGKSNLTGYLAVDSDAGSSTGTRSKDFGKLRLLEISKTGSVVPGPGNVQTSFLTNTAVASEISLLARGGSTTVVYGNLLTVPVGGGLLYVEPIYVKSTKETQYPLLRKVLVAFGDQVAFEDTLDKALDDLFGGNSGASAGDSNVNSGTGSTTGGGTTTTPTTADHEHGPEEGAGRGQDGARGANRRLRQGRPGRRGPGGRATADGDPGGHRRRRVSIAPRAS